MKSKWLMSNVYGVASGGTSYWCPWGGTTVNATEAYNSALCAAAGTIRKLYVLTSGAPAAGTSFDFTVYVNEAPSTITLNIAPGSTSNSDVAHDVAVSAGDRISIQAVSNGAAGGVTATAILEYENAGNVAVLGGGTLNGTLGTIAAFCMLCGHEAGGSGTDSNEHILMPCAGNVTALYVWLSAAPGAGKTRTFYVSKNGATTGAIVVPITGATDTTGNDTAHSIAVVAGDTLSVYMAAATAGTTAAYAKFGIAFTPTTPGQFPIPGTSQTSNLSASAVRYLGLHTVATPSSAIGNRTTIGYSDFQLVGVQIRISTSPGAGTYAFALQEGAGDASEPFAVQIADPATTGSASGTFTPADLGLLVEKVTPASTPTAAAAWVSFTGFMLGGTTALTPAGIADNVNVD